MKLFYSRPFFLESVGIERFDLIFGKNLDSDEFMLEQYNILDFETTGFSPNYDRVIEVGVVKVRDNKIVDTFQSLINPGVHIPSAITSLTGITNEMVKSAPRGPAVMTKLKEFVGEELIVAHNAAFDARFFQAEMNRLRLKSSNNFLCSLLLARRIYQDLQTHRLDFLCRHLGFVNSAAHRALQDVEVTFKVLNDICHRVKVISGRENINSDYLAKLSKVPKSKVQSWLVGA